MKASKVVLASALAVVIGVGAAACVWQHGESTIDENQVAAEVNGTKITEIRVQSYINNFRARSANLSTDEGWQKWLADSGYTDQSYRLRVIDSLIQDELIRQAAADKGIVADPKQVSDQIEATKANYDSEETWRKVLSAAGYTETEYRSAVELTILSKQLKESQVSKPNPTHDQVQAYFNAHAAQYEGKRSSAILFNMADGKLASDVLEELQTSKTLSADFAAYAQEYSIDVSTSKNGGDMGWDCLVALPYQYQNALDKLKVGEMCSAPVQTDYGFYLILCTGEFGAVKNAGDVMVENVPQDIRNTLMNSLTSDLYNQAFDAYLTGLRDAADVTVYNSDGTVMTPADAGAQGASSAASVPAVATTDAAKASALPAAA